MRIYDILTVAYKYLFENVKFLVFNIPRKVTGPSGLLIFNIMSYTNLDYILDRDAFMIKFPILIIYLNCHLIFEMIRQIF